MLLGCFFATASKNRRETLSQVVCICICDFFILQRKIMLGIIFLISYISSLSSSSASSDTVSYSLTSFPSFLSHLFFVLPKINIHNHSLYSSFLLFRLAKQCIYFFFHMPRIHFHIPYTLHYLATTKRSEKYNNDDTLS